ncbi:MAG: zf-HC2 domain-containing protein [Chloroflexi bacterium]|uniref:Zf-HC2 domain-containing protein n=1 Tax=Candidatus Chlorohelix allophototropha TaxID=3003348 RepID=A0A8T7LYJ7_9CHLR|nr:zf-HC2 domain-containing protein [Chloroflexota bacterium]WJW66412.1 zf-HC2 domain-containing protein [Chloroflexota bacterium L227-S17]
MFCREMNQHISPYLDGVLNTAQTQKVEAHVEICPKCRHSLSLMQEIPKALHTDRMLAPKEDFTAAIMQQIIINHHLSSSLGTTAQPETVRKVAEVVPFDAARHKRAARASTTNYVLRFAAMAAVLMVMVGVGAYLNVLTGNGTGGTQAAFGAAIGNFAGLLADSVQSPLILLLGVALTAGIIIATWWFIHRTQTRH